jgi:hypothetical protein
MIIFGWRWITPVDFGTIPGAEMRMNNDLTDEEKIHRQFAVDLFNATWDLMDKPVRTKEEDDEMIHRAHASRYHWGIVGAPVNLARGEWQIARVYTILNRSEPAHYHALRCLEICQANQIGDFDLAYAYEALARVNSIQNKIIECLHYLKLARKAGEAILEQEDREHFFKDLGSIQIDEPFVSVD